MSRVLVTGGAGYVGSHAVLALAAAGHDVVVYDNLSAGHAEAVERIAAAHPRRSVVLIRGDITDEASMFRTLRGSGATVVLHFAAKISVSTSVKDPMAYYHTNVTGTLAVLGAMARAGVDRFVLSSTAATFGEPQATPIDETHSQRPINAYGETKLAVERALPHVERATGLRWAVLRCFNAAGADPHGVVGEDHRPEDHLIPLALSAVWGGAPLTVFGGDYATSDGTCIRDFVHVSDLADAHVASVRALEGGAASAAYNLGSGHGVSVREVMESVRRVTGLQVPHRVGPRRPGDPMRLVASSEGIRKALGWAPKFQRLDAIVETAWQWLRKHPQGYGGIGAG